MPNEYSTLAKLRDYLTLNVGATSSVTQDDGLLTSLFGKASRSIDKYTRRMFYPRVETRFYNYKDAHKLKFDDDLLSLTTFLTQNGASTVASGVIWLATGEEWNRPPYDRIVLDDSSGSILQFSGTHQRANEITGVWGYHEDYNGAWVNTGTSLNNAYTASGVSLDLAGAGSVGVGASDVNYEYPRIAIGNLLKVGDEFFHVVAGGTSGNGSVIVQPYANGTTGASHASGTSIAKFEHEPDIEWCARRLAAWSYGQKDTPYTTRTANVNFGELQIPSAWPTDVREKLERFVKRGFAVIP